MSTYILHSAKGSTWKNHKYIEIVNGRYVYPKKQTEGPNRSPAWYTKKREEEKIQTTSETGRYNSKASKEYNDAIRDTWNGEERSSKTSVKSKNRKVKNIAISNVGRAVNRAKTSNKLIRGQGAAGGASNVKSLERKWKKSTAMKGMHNASRSALSSAKAQVDSTNQVKKKNKTKLPKGSSAALKGVSNTKSYMKGKKQVEDWYSRKTVFPQNTNISSKSYLKKKKKR